MTHRTTTRCFYCRREIEHLWQLADHIACVPPPTPEPTPAHTATEARKAVKYVDSIKSLSGQLRRFHTHGRRRRR